MSFLYSIWRRGGGVPGPLPPVPGPPARCHNRLGLSRFPYPMPRPPSARPASRLKPQPVSGLIPSQEFQLHSDFGETDLSKCLLTL